MGSITPKIFHMQTPTHHANLMMRYMIARNLQASIPELIISNVDLPMWSIHHANLLRTGSERICRIIDEQHVNFQKIQYFCKNNIFERFEWIGYGQRMENFPSREYSNLIFSADDAVGFQTPPGYIICPIRGAEIFDAVHPNYPIIPIDFYADVFHELDLKPIFMGQTSGHNPYMAALRRRFPHAEFLQHRNVLEDFQTIRKAKNILLPVSTFAWLAAWLSHATTIIMPVFGIYNYKSLTSHDLLPIGESRYRFFEFPLQEAVSPEEVLTAHSFLKGRWKEVSRLDFAPATL